MVRCSGKKEVPEIILKGRRQDTTSVWQLLITKSIAIGCHHHQQSLSVPMQVGVGIAIGSDI
jgi:hypothetical protein